MNKYIQKMIHTHTHWNITQPQKEENLVICDNIDGSWEHYAKWN